MPSSAPPAAVVADRSYFHSIINGSCKPLSHRAAFEKSIELVFDKLRQARPGLRFDLGRRAGPLVSSGFVLFWKTNDLLHQKL